MATPDIYFLVDPREIDPSLFSWQISVIRGDPRDTSIPPRVIRDDQGQPIERDVTIYTALPVAIFPPSPSDVEAFRQRGVDLSHTAVVRADPTTGVLPDIRHQDRLLFEGRYLEVLTSQDVGEAGIIRQMQCRERRPGSG